ncbi:MAG: hypothetical protein AVDCRST_MAG35-854 [uncultured Quadrisphaera sp.]|uniref:Sugar-binding domain-containing protein n=1 Tax=uncultured Quadrisphaera sp. TaxID=904978 RepID=A0A6J4NXB7_9ACTN|nr:MAG: hypothetical protein AVDCRST_MAG35-854 [uncultured Quadrisphaera sp.]
MVVTGPDRPDVEGGARAAAGDTDRAYLDLVHAAATMYHLEDATQAQVSERLGTSRTTVSRLLSDARRLGIVRIQVVRPQHADPAQLAARLCELTGLAGVHLGAARASHLSASLGPVVHDVLAGVGLDRGDVLLVSSGRTTSEIAQGPLPHLPGVRVAPTIGGIDQAQAWYQPNETARQVAEKVGGSPLFLFAPALPSAALHEGLVGDPAIRRVLDAWEEARCAVVGVGAPPARRTSLPSFVDTTDEVIMSSAGDVNSRFYDASGAPLPFRGADRLMATSLERMRTLERCIAVAVGAEKVPSIVAGARAGYFSDLVTSVETALALLDALTQEG